MTARKSTRPSRSVLARQAGLLPLTLHASSTHLTRQAIGVLDHVTAVAFLGIPDERLHLVAVAIEDTGRNPRMTVDLEPTRVTVTIGQVRVASWEVRPPERVALGMLIEDDDE